jgi:hypothetical protein
MQKSWKGEKILEREVKRDNREETESWKIMAMLQLWTCYPQAC